MKNILTKLKRRIIRRRMIEQVGEKVKCYSSQYGGPRNSRSYSAANLEGPCSNYPNYGDFIQAFVLRTYGPWWQLCPSAAPVIRRRPPEFQSEDFVEISFEEKVYPRSVDIYETYNPGAIVRILAAEVTTHNGLKQKRWHTLWSGPPGCAEEISRKFSPELRRVNFPTKLIRLEFNSSHLNYYTELDGITLCGYSEHLFYSHSKETDLDELLSGKLSGLSVEDGHFQSNNGYFDKLPVEVLQKIFSYLDLLSLCKCAQVCTLFRDNAYDPLQYTDLDLQPFWTQVNNETLLLLTERCRHVNRLSLTWTGSKQSLSSPAVSKFIRDCGSELSLLSLSGCSFVKFATLEAVEESSFKITSIDLSRCRHLSDADLSPLLGLTLLESINLCDTTVSDRTLCGLAWNNTNLKHLNIDCCPEVVQMDTVTLAISQNCRNFQSLNTWRNKHMTAAALSHLYLCKELQEIDLGWCSLSSSLSLVNLAKNCVKLKKVFLTAYRKVNDTDIRAFSDNLPDLEQLDILGTSLVSADAILHLLKSCHGLIYLDVSFCHYISNSIVHDWRASFPHVNIKKNFRDE